MKIKGFKEASKLFNEIKNTKKMIESFSFGTVSNEKTFIENNSDFHIARFLKIVETESTCVEAGTTWNLKRLSIRDDSNCNRYDLTKQETIELQNYIKSILENRLKIAASKFEQI